MTGFLNGIINIDLTLKDLMVDEVLSSPYVYEQEYIKLILPQGSSPVSSVIKLVEHSGNGIKVEGYEKLSLRLHQASMKLASDCHHNGPVTCHLFISPKGSLSFPRHIDPDRVILFMLDGHKELNLDTGAVSLNPGDIFEIATNEPHQVVNKKDSVMLSFGLEHFTVDKI